MLGRANPPGRQRRQRHSIRKVDWTKRRGGSHGVHEEINMYHWLFPRTPPYHHFSLPLEGEPRRTVQSNAFCHTHSCSCPLSVFTFGHPQVWPEMPTVAPYMVHYPNTEQLTQTLTRQNSKQILLWIHQLAAQGSHRRWCRAQRVRAGLTPVGCTPGKFGWKGDPSPPPPTLVSRGHFSGVKRSG